jgi:hypothetical protein
MSVPQEIFDGFLKKLEAARLPAKLITELRRLWESNEIESKDNILNILKVAIEDVPNQDN